MLLLDLLEELSAETLVHDGLLIVHLRRLLRFDLICRLKVKLVGPLLSGCKLPFLEELSS